MFFSNSPIVLFFWRRRGGESAFARVITPCYRRHEVFFLPLSISAKIYYKIQKSRQFSDFFKIAPPPDDASKSRPRAGNAKEKRPQHLKAFSIQFAVSSGASCGFIGFYNNFVIIDVVICAAFLTILLRCEVINFGICRQKPFFHLGILDGMTF